MPIDTRIDPSTTKYIIKARIVADGVVEKPDVVGAIFGQTEGLLGEELDLRDLQKTGRMGRIEVDVNSKKGKSEGSIIMPSSLDQVETSILAAALETIDRVGPCKAQIIVSEIEDVRVAKKTRIIERAKELLKSMARTQRDTELDISDEVRQAVQVEDIVSFGPDKCPAGPNVASSDSIIVVEGRSDVLNLLRYGIKNAIAVEGTNVPQTIKNLTKERSAIAFVDGDRGGELILRELLQVAELDFIAMAPRNREVEELTQKQIMKALRNKIPINQFIEMHGMRDLKLAGTEEGPLLAQPDDDDEEAGTPAVPDVGQPMAKPVAMVDQPTTGLPPVGPGPQPGGPRPYRDDRVPRTNGGPRPPEGDRPVGGDRSTVGGDRPGTGPDRRGGFFSGITDRLRGKGDKKFSDEQIAYKDMLQGLQGTFKANLLGAKSAVIKEVPVRDLAEALAHPPDGTLAVVFDGVITQRILDLAAEKGIKTLVGVKYGSITKQPTDMEVLTKADLE
jgi:DNA primase